VTYKLEGHTEVTPGAGVPSAVLPGGRYDAKLSLDTPESVDFSVTQKMNDAWKVYAGATWTRWSRLQDITVKNSGIVATSPFDATPTLANTITEEQKWHDTWAYALGTSYQLNKQWVLRTGLSFDQSPTNNDDRSPRIPTGDRTIFSLGAGYSPTDDITIDVAYSYLKEESVKVRDTNALGQSYNAKYENSANGFGLGLTYRF
jgi:long-chain fatty acid transport protein